MEGRGRGVLHQKTTRNSYVAAELAAHETLSTHVPDLAQRSGGALGRSDEAAFGHQAGDRLDVAR
jgi:hypothetical protein